MAAFAAGEADVLVATTVIEVGIDVPNATVMLVEDAERYGISQLHQLRGRVGRGEHASLCLLFGPKESRAPARRSPTHADGFRLAEIDLELRGEGELTGTRQSGLARFRFARLPEDAELLERARARAPSRSSPPTPSSRAPEHALLADALRATRGESTEARSRPERRREGRRRALGGRRLAAPPGRRRRGRRRDRVREALFTTLGPLDGARVLDLFAGSGALGDRGALARRGAARRSSSATRARDRGRSGATSPRSASSAERRGAPPDAPRGPARRTRRGRRIRSGLPRPSVPARGRRWDGARRTALAAGARARRAGRERERPPRAAGARRFPRPTSAATATP